MPELIYLDYHSSTPTDPRVLESMLPYFTAVCSNPSNPLHEGGRKAAEAVERARRHVADLIGARPREVVFTSGATESNNLAVLGLAHGAKAAGIKRRRILVSPIEHKSVLEPCKELALEEFEILFVPVDPAGAVKLEALEHLLNDDVLLVSVQAANNEIGTIQEVAKIVELSYNSGAFVHCDAAQAVGKIPIKVDRLGVDLLSLSSHKMYGPKGIGALYIRGGVGGLPLTPLQRGGGQEWELRPGTLNVAGIVGLGEAARICGEVMAEESERVGQLRDTLEENLLANIPNTKRNGLIGNRLPNNSSLTFLGVDAQALILSMPEIALSMGAACTAGTIAPSYVLEAIGCSREYARSTVRIGLGRFTTREEVSVASQAFQRAYQRLMSL